MRELKKKEKNPFARRLTALRAQKMCLFMKNKGGVLRCQIQFDVQNDQGQGNHVAETPKTPHSIQGEAQRTLL